jgi:hypothetical protein
MSTVFAKRKQERDAQRGGLRLACGQWSLKQSLSRLSHHPGIGPFTT